MSNETNNDGTNTNGWLPIETAPMDGTAVDLWGYIQYDSHDFRLTDCEYFANRGWHFFRNGEMISVGEISYTPTFWRPIPKAPWDVE